MKIGQHNASSYTTAYHVDMYPLVKLKLWKLTLKSIKSMKRAKKHDNFDVKKL